MDIFFALIIFLIIFYFIFFKHYDKNYSNSCGNVVISCTSTYGKNTTLHKIIDNDNTLNSIVNDFESRKHAKAKDLEKSLGKALPNDVIWGVLQDIFLESFIKNHKVLLNCVYQQGLLVQKEKNYKQAIVSYAYGLYYLMNFYKADFRPMAHIIDYVSTETELIEMAQEKFINKIQRCVKYANLEVTEIKTIASKLILGSPLPYLEFEDFFTIIEPYLFKKDMSYPNQSSGDLQSKPLEEWSWAYNGNDELMNGLIFQATLQLRTPLEVLKHHNEVFNNKREAPPQYAKEGWEGMWLPNLKTWRELGIDEDEMPNHTVSTDIGSLEDDEAEKYYKFLLEFHTIVENNHLSVKDKINHLETLYHDNPHYNNFFDRNSFESYFGLLISNVFSSKVALTLKNAGFRTLEDLKGADLEYLVTLNGIGKATLEKLKPYVNATNSP